MVVVIHAQQRTVRAMRRVPTRFPADQWPGEPLAETGEWAACAKCKRMTDLCDLRDGWCCECEIAMTHPQYGWMHE